MREEDVESLALRTKERAVHDGLTVKKWVTAGDEEVCEARCALNAEQGWIPIAQPFQSGQDVYPAHTDCRCVVIYRGGDTN